MLKVTPIPAFNDNYLWLIENKEECWVVDPGDAIPVQNALEERGRQLTGILVTHHHRDHIGGIQALYKDGMKVIGPSLNPYELVNDRVSDGDIREVCGVDFNVIEVPGHTLNHLAYYAEPKEQKPLLFCGDTLFAGGCGRLFEGTPEQMYSSLSRLSALSEESLVYCAHEYTLANLAFAETLEPDNQALIGRIKESVHLRKKSIPTVPSSLKVEKKTNPFLRTTSNELIEKAKLFEPNLKADPVAIFATIRKMKDQF